MTDADPIVTIAATPRDWGARLHAHAADHGGVVVRATVLTAADAREEDSAVLLVDDITSFLTAHLVLQLRQQGRAVLGIHDRDDAQGRRDLLDAGVDALMPADADAAALVDAVRHLATRRPEDRPKPARSGRRSPAEPGRARVIGVLGAGGGVGTTEVALAVACGQASMGHESVLIDADELGGSMAQRMRLPQHPNLRTAVDALLAGGDVAAAMTAVSRRVPLRTVAGLPMPTDWACLGTAALTDLVAATTAVAARVVIDLGRAPERADTPTGPRYGHAAAQARACHDVIVVCTPTPVAVARCLSHVAALGGTAPSAVDGGQGPRLHLVVNQTPPTRFIRRETAAELRRATGVDRVHELPRDPRVADAAWEGRAVRSGRFTRALTGLLAGLEDRAVAQRRTSDIGVPA